AHVSTGRRDLVASFEAGRTVLDADAAELHDWTVRHCKVGDPDIVVAVHDHGPWPGETAACERRTWKLRALGPEQCDTAACSRLLGHGRYHVTSGRLDPRELQACRHVHQTSHA